MQNERKSSSINEVVSEISLADEGLKIIGFGCTLCPWQVNETEYFKTLPKFGDHNNQKHVNTPSTHIVYIYKRIK